MSKEIKKAIQIQMSEISDEIAKGNLVGNPEGLFTRFVLSQTSHIDLNVNCDEEWIKEHEMEIKHGNYLHLASLGFSLMTDSDPALKRAFSKGLSQIKTMNAFPLDRMSFVFYPRMFLGIILGIKAISNSENEIKWSCQILEERQKMNDFDQINKLLYQVLESILHDRTILIEHSTVELLSKIEEMSIVYWGSKRMFFSLSNLEDITYIKKSIMNKIVLESNFENNLLPFVSFAISTIVMETTDSVILTIEHISKILGNFESAMERWVWKDDKQWRIDDEYDIQSILYLILRSFFDDTEYEVPTQKFGHGHSRVDLVIPSQQVMIEAKFVRKTSDFKKIENEIKIDSVDYPKSSPYKKIVVFIYDASSSVQVHQKTISALKQIDSIQDVIIASKPSHMNN